MSSLSPFDTLAQTYDADFTTSSIGILQRKRVWSLLSPLLSEQGRSLQILEINCGTGEDAINMAAMGHVVKATDASAMMIEKAIIKLNTSSQPAAVSFSVCSFDQLRDQFANEQFDLIFSNFGGLNCVSDDSLIQLSKDLDALIKPEGQLFFVLLSRWCIWEMLYFGIRGKFSTAFRRWRSWVPFTIMGQTIPVYYYSPRGLQKTFASFFQLQKKHPVGLFIPPSYLENKFTKKVRQLNKLNSREERFGYSFLSSFGDHFCVIFKNKKKNE